MEIFACGFLILVVLCVVAVLLWLSRKRREEFKQVFGFNPYAKTDSAKEMKQGFVDETLRRLAQEFEATLQEESGIAKRLKQHDSELYWARIEAIGAHAAGEAFRRAQRLARGAGFEVKGRHGDYLGDEYLLGRGVPRSRLKTQT